MYRSYEERDDLLVGPRGRIDVVAQQRMAGLPLPVACRFDEHTLDVPVNRLIKAAAHRLLFVPGVTAATRRALSGLLVRLEEVSALRGPELRVGTAFTRLNEHLAGAERLARIVLGGTAMVDRIGDVPAGVFMVHMPTLFEDFVTDRLRRHLRGRLDVVAQDRRWLTAPGSPVRRSIRPDLLFRRGPNYVYVGDVKYKLDNDARARDGDVYQLLAYTTALGSPEGILVYCRDTPGDRVGELRVARTGTRLFAYPIEIGESVAALEREVADLARWIARRVEVTAAGATMS
jgi:5-methylcytosine-specific restriction enzyme subunit McrC